MISHNAMQFSWQYHYLSVIVPGLATLSLACAQENSDEISRVISLNASSKSPSDPHSLAVSLSRSSWGTKGWRSSVVEGESSKTDPAESPGRPLCAWDFTCIRYVEKLLHVKNNNVNTGAGRDAHSPQFSVPWICPHHKECNSQSGSRQGKAVGFHWATEWPPRSPAHTSRSVHPLTRAPELSSNI